MTNNNIYGYIYGARYGAGARSGAGAGAGARTGAGNFFFSNIKFIIFFTLK